MTEAADLLQSFYDLCVPQLRLLLTEHLSK